MKHDWEISTNQVYSPRNKGIDAMKATITCLAPESSVKFAHLARKQTGGVPNLRTFIVNKFLGAIELSSGRQGLRDLDRRLLEDIGLTPFDRDQLLG
jgi:hypothetical protein